MNHILSVIRRLEGAFAPKSPTQKMKNHLENGYRLRDTDGRLSRPKEEEPVPAPQTSSRRKGGGLTQQPTANKVVGPPALSSGIMHNDINVLFCMNYIYGLSPTLDRRTTLLQVQPNWELNP